MKTLITLLFFICLCCSRGQFVFTNLYMGISNNSGTGDGLNVAGPKINANFYYLTNQVGIVSNAVVNASNVTWTAANAGSNVNTAAILTTSNSLQTQITGDMATNTAAFGIRINPLAAAIRWTNDAQRATAEIEAKFTDAVGGVPQCSITVEHGTQSTNNWQLSPIGGGLGATLTTPITNRWTFTLSPSAVVIFTDTSSGGASAALSRTTIFRW